MQNYPNPEQSAYQQQPYQQQSSAYPPQQPYQQPPLTPPVPPRKPKRWGWIVGIIVAFLIGLAFGHIGGGSAATATSNNTTTQSAAQTQATQAPQAKTAAPKWTTTHTFKGNGSQKTSTFSVGNDWKIQWKCDPTSFQNIQYNVIVGVNNSDNTPVDPAAINSLCKSGNTSGVTEEHQGGNVYLDINSEGDWTITVQELK